ncbi:hypothetical protein B0H13DRAFT_2123017 [Mycena leptocephala]|nr:hypothetical protein B0H13DRAFT_2123017 [Mycena leptocephala]
MRSTRLALFTAANCQTLLSTYLAPSAILRFPCIYSSLRQKAGQPNLPSRVLPRLNLFDSHEESAKICGDTDHSIFLMVAAVPHVLGNF